MPLGAARLNTLSKVLTVAASTDRTTGFMNVIANGDAQLSNAQYKFNTGSRGGSIYMDGTGDYLSMDDNASSNLDFGTDDFTIEWFQYLTSLDRFAIDMRDGSNGAKILLYSYPSDGSADDLYLWVNSANQITASNCLSANQWQHIALVRESSTTSLYVDGSQVGSTYSDSNNYQHTELLIWENSLSAGNYTPPGYVDEFRISDTARYSGASLTVPTSAFTQDNNTRLLLHGDGPYGNNGNRHIVDDIGDLRPLDIHIEQNVTVNSGSAASISTAQSKFGGSSLRLNDNDSHCQYVSPAWGSAFTIEFWFRADSVSAGTQWMAGVWGGTPHGGFNWIVGLSNSTVKTYFFTTAGSYSLNNATIGTASANTWHHVAITWDGSTYRTFLDGTAGGSASDSNAPASDQWQVTWVGTVGGTTDTFAGYIDEYRQSDTARYTSNFTPSSSAFADDSNTKVLLHFDGSNADTTTIDGDPPARAGAATRSVDLGGTSVSSTGGKFGGAASGSSDASDYIETNPGGSWTLDSDQVWTCEFFFKTSSSFSPTSNIALAGLNFGNISGIRLEANTNGQLKAMVGGSSNSYSFNHSTSYQHLAWVSDGAGTVKFYLDGTEQISVGSYSYNMSSPTDKRFYYGSASGQSGQPTYSFDELRISRVQRYTSGFTPTTTAFTNDEDTVALFHFDNNYDDDNS